MKTKFSFIRTALLIILFISSLWTGSVCAQLIDHIRYNSVREPATMLLLGCVLIGIAAFGRKKFFKK